MTPEERRDADYARLDERTKNLMGVAERFEKIFDKLPCTQHANRLTRLETRITFVIALGSLVGGALAGVLTRALGG